MTTSLFTPLDWAGSPSGPQGSRDLVNIKRDFAEAQLVACVFEGTIFRTPGRLLLTETPDIEMASNSLSMFLYIIAFHVRPAGLNLGRVPR
jgi:hypothetical protein